MYGMGVRIMRLSGTAVKLTFVQAQEVCPYPVPFGLAAGFSLREGLKVASSGGRTEACCCSRMGVPTRRVCTALLGPLLIILTGAGGTRGEQREATSRTPSRIFSTKLFPPCEQVEEVENGLRDQGVGLGVHHKLAFCRD